MVFGNSIVRVRWGGRYTKLLVAAMVSAAMVFGSAACDSSSTQSGPLDIKIGMPLPLSGSDAVIGKDDLQGAQLAADIINNGLPGLTLPLVNHHGLPDFRHATFTIVSADTAGQPANGASAVSHLVNDEHVSALSGAYESGVTATAATQAERLGVPFVNGDSSAPELTQQGLEWFFRTGPTDLTFGQAFFGLLGQEQKKNVSATRLGVLYMNNQFGIGADKVVKELANAHGETVVADVPYDPAVTDLTSQVQNIRAQNPDVLFIAAYASSATLFINAVKQLGYLPPAVMAFGAGFSDIGFLKSTGEDLEGITRRVAWSLDLANRNPTAKLVADAYQKRYGAPMTENSSRVFTAVMALAQAIDNARSTDPNKIRAALTALDVPGRDTIMPWDGIKFDDQHQNTKVEAVIEQYLHGSWRAVYPDDVASEPVVWPANSVRNPR